jgi:alpha-galactosidase
MLVIGMDRLNFEMNKSHMAMWCMMNSPLMLGLDLRRVEKGDWIYNLITNEDLIALDQDPLGIQAKRIYTTLPCSDPSLEYIRDNDRADVLAKPLSDGSIALAFFNLKQTAHNEAISISVDNIIDSIGAKMENAALSDLKNASSFDVKDLFSKSITRVDEKQFTVDHLDPCGCKVIKITPAL